MAMVGSVTMSVLDIVGVAALVPLVQLATSTDRDTGAIGVITRLSATRRATPSDAKLAVVIAVFMVTAFVLKGVLGISLRWWQLGFVARQERETAARLLRGYLAAPYVVLHRAWALDAGLPGRRGRQHDLRQGRGRACCPSAPSR